MVEQNISLNLRLRKINETRNCFWEEVKQNYLVSKCKKVFKTLNYIQHSHTLVPFVTGCVSISAFASLAEIAIGIASFEVGLNICVLTAAIKKYKSIIMNNRKKHDKIVLLAKTKLNIVEVLISKALINFNHIIAMMNLF